MELLPELTSPPGLEHEFKEWTQNICKTLPREYSGDSRRYNNDILAKHRKDDTLCYRPQQVRSKLGDDDYLVSNAQRETIDRNGKQGQKFGAREQAEPHCEQLCHGHVVEEPLKTMHAL